MKPMSPETMFDVLTLGFFWLDGGRVGAHRKVNTVLSVLRKCEVWGKYDPSKDRDLVSLFHRRTALYAGSLNLGVLAPCGSHYATRVPEPKDKRRVMARMLMDVFLYLTPKGSAYASRAVERRAEYVTKEQFLAAWDALQIEWAEQGEAGRIAMFEASRRRAAGEGIVEP
jgi:hypothetical protein